MGVVSNLALAFQLVVSENGPKIALQNPESGEVTTYYKLARLADTIAQQLVFRGYRRGDVVAIFHDKSPAAFASMLACLRVGILYTNLDPYSPWERLKKILTTCQPSVLINSFSDLDQLPDVAEICDIVEIGELMVEVPSEVFEMPACKDIPGSTPSYIMFTSGSTGSPKGAVMSHSNLLCFIAWSQDRFGITPDDILTNVNPIYFDNSVFDFYTAIFTGATLVPFSHTQAKDPRLLVRLAEKSRCTIWFSVPSLLVYLLKTRTLSTESLPNIRKIIFGGEGFPKPKLKQLFDMFGQRAELENVYGPTECTCICSAHTIGAEDFEDMRNFATMGNLSQNFEGKISSIDANDPNFGELILLGTQVGLGYYNDTERTAQSFIQNPNHSRYRDIGYRTGDLVLQDSNNQLHFKGRADFQIKHMGYRIELEEIEAALASIAEVDECAVVYQQLGDSMGELLGFVTGDQRLESDQLILRVASIVPPYMVPKRIRILEYLPKNANGKIDRLSLLKLSS
jgi:D-alanine--poly(phosphoribitol) ligase subunit 1